MIGLYYESLFDDNFECVNRWREEAALERGEKSTEELAKEVTYCILF